MMLPDYIQYGFAGFAFLMMGVIVWLIGKLLSVIDRFHEAVMANARAFELFRQQLDKFGVALERILDKLDGMTKGHSE